MKDNPSWINRLSYQVYLRFARIIRSMPLIHRCLFGYRPLCNNSEGSEYWDWTTLILRKALRKHIGSDDSFLDMGTGPVAVLAIYACLKLDCKKVHAADHLEILVSSAKRNAEALGLNIEFHCSNLFENISNTYDVIAFNAPYLDIEDGRRRGILNSKLSELRFSGGAGGGEVIERFLRDAPQYMSDNGKLLLGVNHFHISRSTVQKFISGSGLKLDCCMESPIFPGSAYILCRTHMEE